MARSSPDASQPDAATPDRATGGSQADNPERVRRVGVLSTHNSKETKAILNAIRALGHEPVWIRNENVTSWIEDGSVVLEPDVDVLINRLLLTKSDRKLEDLQLAALYGEQVPVLNPPETVERTLHKYRSGAVLARAGLPVPDAFFGRSPRTFDDRESHLPGTVAHKRTVGTNGRQMEVVPPDQRVVPYIGNEPAFLQEFLDSEDRPWDVRVYVVGDRIVGAMRRRAPDGEWRTNVALGGETEDITDELGSRPRRLACEAVATLDLDVAGVDLMAADGEWYVLEVNATAGFRGLFSATGTSVAPYVARLAIERVDGRVDDATVTDLAETLDDSVPDCKPPLVEEDDDTLGYTTRIDVGGTDGVETVVAKSDTGAQRTSVDTKLAGRIGLGPMMGSAEVRSAAGSGTDTRPLVEIDLYVNGRWRTVAASVTDRSRMTHPVLLGRDVLTDYVLDVSRTAEE